MKLVFYLQMRSQQLIARKSDKKRSERELRLN